MTRVSTLFLATIMAISSAAVAQTEDASQEYPRQALRHSVDSTVITIAYPDAAGSKSTSITFDKDVRVSGNGLPAGTYEIGLIHVAKDDTQIIFSARAVGEGESVSEPTEKLRLAVRPADAPKVDRLTVEIEPVKIEEPPEGQRRRRRRRQAPSAMMDLRWAAHKATVKIEMTGTVWRSTPPPEIPEHLRDPWAIVLSSLRGLTEESMEKHVEHFADDFISEWDDGGSQEAHEQMIGRRLYDGGLEGSVLKLHGLEWTEAEDGVQFRGILVQYGPEEAPLIYKARETNQGWKIVHLDGPKE